jgi:hypothetical protein
MSMAPIWQPQINEVPKQSRSKHKKTRCKNWAIRVAEINIRLQEKAAATCKKQAG